MSIVVIVLITYAIAELMRECERLEREWHALGEAAPPAKRTGRWTDFNL